MTFLGIRNLASEAPNIARNATALSLCEKRGVNTKRTGDGRITAYGSVIDTQTQDRPYVPGAVRQTGLVTSGLAR